MYYWLSQKFVHARMAHDEPKWPKDRLQYLFYIGKTEGTWAPHFHHIENSQQSCQHYDTLAKAMAKATVHCVPHRDPMFILTSVYLQKKGKWQWSINRHNLHMWRHEQMELDTRNRGMEQSHETRAGARGMGVQAQGTVLIVRNGP